jgi:hypothetical protein
VRARVRGQKKYQSPSPLSSPVEGVEGEEVKAEEVACDKE